MHADYPRPLAAMDDAVRLSALADGYFRLTPIFLGTLLLGYPVQGVLFVGCNGAPTLIPITLFVTTAVVARLSVAPLRRIGLGSGWAPATPVVIALALGLTAPLCCGAVGFPLVLGATMRRMRRLGVRVGFLGPTKEDVLARHRELASGCLRGGRSRSGPT